MSSKNRIDYVVEATRTSVEFNDHYFNVGSIMADYDKGFVLKKMPNREMSYKNNFQNAVTIELSLNQVVYYRRIYSFLELIADLGGLAGGLKIVCYGIITAYSYYGAY